ncbi:MAG: transketolase [Candidatus Aureabacteria bacterium]|nr:transketolase [Candidatus Auribacterota bacterium]
MRLTCPRPIASIGSPPGGYPSVTTRFGGSTRRDRKQTAVRPLNDSFLRELEERARTIRMNIIRMIARAGSGHPGGSLSIADILTALYFTQMRHRPKEPRWADRDRCILSKGHAAPALYAVLGECGYFPKGEFLKLRRVGAMLQGHPDATRVPGVETSTGSLGQGISVGVGMALAGRIDGRGYRVYVVLGDGEIEEGEVWEAAMAAAHYRLDRLCAIVDFNGLQIDGRVQDTMNPEPIAAKWEAFGWAAREIDGHDFRQIIAALDWAAEPKKKPSAIIARTVKGKGVSFMEAQVNWHGVAPTAEESKRALAELGEA